MIYQDNQMKIPYGERDFISQRTKYIKVYFHYIKDKIAMQQQPTRRQFRGLLKPRRQIHQRGAQVVSAMLHISISGELARSN